MTSIYSKIGSIAALGLLVTLAGCGSINDSLNERANGHTKQYTFEKARQGTDSDVLPPWLPDSATHVKEVMRTTGNERILTATLGPNSRLKKCLTKNDKSGLDSFNQSTLRASWWKNRSADEANATCGKWSIAVKGDTVFAFVPESPEVKLEEQDTVYH